MTDILLPPGRLVGGSLYKPNTTNYEGGPLTDKHGNPRSSFDFSVAIPKNGERHWAETPWGAPIWAEGNQAFPGVANQMPAFSWKISDGDSTIPNKKNNKPCDREGWPGHWVVHFSSSFNPLIVDDKKQVIAQEDAVKPGYFVEVAGSVTSNKNHQNPGVYINHDVVCFRAYGEVIQLGGRQDASAIAFGQAALPPGAQSTPTASSTPIGGHMPPPAQGQPPAQQQYQPPAQQQYQPPAQHQYQPPAQHQYQPPAQQQYQPPAQGQTPAQGGPEFLHQS